MDTTIGNIKAARAKAMQSSMLRKELNAWFKRKGSCPAPEIKDFGKWVEWLVNDVARNIHDDRNVNIHNLVEGLRVQVIGDRFAKLYAGCAAVEGYETDTNCYIEEGVVHADVWLHGNDPKATEEKANAIAAKFRKLGYAASVWVDEEEEHDVIVNSCLDFPLYVELTKKGGR